ncbi:MAG: lysylphosphatidylglycerol synthase transmembrane domain-containing protein [Rikenellaceae bacterium]
MSKLNNKISDSAAEKVNKVDAESQIKHLSKIKPSRIAYPVIIGLLVVAYLIWREVDVEALKQIQFTWRALFWIFMALLCMVGRDFGYIYRIKVLSRGQLSWIESFRIIMLWEFTSAITPSAIGGTSFAIIYVHKEGVSLGRSSAIVLLTSFLDELYFVVMLPLLLFAIGKSKLFGVGDGMVESGIITVAFVGYFIKLAYTLLISYGLFINPKGFKWLLFKLFHLPYLRKFKRSAIIVGNDIAQSSKEIKGQGLKFWFEVISSTFLSWSSRYFVVNALILGFFVFSDHFLLFARQLVMWIMMLIMPTPGGSGFAEYFFKEYLNDFIPVAGLGIILALIWRLVTYYPYLVIGAIIFPRWVKDKFRG